MASSDILEIGAITLSNFIKNLDELTACVNVTANHRDPNSTYAFTLKPGRERFSIGRKSRPDSPDDELAFTICLEGRSHDVNHDYEVTIYSHFPVEVMRQLVALADRLQSAERGAVG